MNNKGITLIELLIVVAIIGILAVIAVPAYIGQQRNAQRTEAYTNLQNLRLLEEQYFAENGEYTPNNAVANSTAATRLRYDTTYNWTSNAADPLSLVRYLPGFRPGDAAGLGYDYYIEWTVTGAAAPFTTTTFVARAVGRAGKRVAGDDFWIDNNNNRNF